MFGSIFKNSFKNNTGIPNNNPAAGHSSVISASEPQDFTAVCLVFNSVRDEGHPAV